MASFFMFMLSICILSQKFVSIAVSYSTIDGQWYDDYEISKPSWDFNKQTWYYTPGWSKSTATFTQNQITYHGPFSDGSYTLSRDFNCAHHSNIDVQYKITFCGNATGEITAYIEKYPWIYTIEKTLVDIDFGYSATNLNINGDECVPWNYYPISPRYDAAVSSNDIWTLYFDIDVDDFNYVALYDIEIQCNPFPTTRNPTYEPTPSPTPAPTPYPSYSPTNVPSAPPTKNPSKNPSIYPTKNPTNIPSTSPTNEPTLIPTKDPTNDPSSNPTTEPTVSPTTPSPTLVDRITHKPINSPTVTTTNINNIQTTQNQHKSMNHESTNHTKMIQIVILIAAIVLCCVVIWILIFWFIKNRRKSKKQSVHMIDFKGTPYVQLTDNIEQNMNGSGHDSDDDMYNYSHPTPQAPYSNIMNGHKSTAECADDIALPETPHSPDVDDIAVADTPRAQNDIDEQNNEQKAAMFNVYEEGDADDDEVLIGMDTVQ